MKQRAARPQHPGQLLVEPPRIQLPGDAEAGRIVQHHIEGTRAQRFDVGVKYGLFTAQLALALSGEDRAEVLTQLVNILAAREMLPEQGAAD